MRASALPASQRQQPGTQPQQGPVRQGRRRRASGQNVGSRRIDAAPLQWRGQWNPPRYLLPFTWNVTPQYHTGGVEAAGEGSGRRLHQDRGNSTSTVKRSASVLTRRAPPAGGSETAGDGQAQAAASISAALVAWTNRAVKSTPGEALCGRCF